MTLSVSSMALVYSTIQYLYRMGRWNPDSEFGHHLQMYFALAILTSFGLAVAGMIRDRQLWLGIIALVISFLGLLSLAAG